MSDEAQIEPQSDPVPQTACAEPQTRASKSKNLGIVLQDAEGRIQACNAIAAQILGMTPDQLTGATPYNLPWQVIQVDGSPFPNDQFPVVIALRTGQPSDVVCGFYRPDGELIWFLMDAQPLFRVGQTTPYAVAVTLEPIPTPQLSADLENWSVEAPSSQPDPSFLSLAQLYDSKPFLQSIIKTVPGILYLFDLIEQRNIFVNQQVAEYLGYSTEAIQAMGSEMLLHLFHPEDLARVPHHMAQFNTAQAGDSFEFEYRMQHSNGEWRWFSTREVLFSRTLDERPHRILGISQDITSYKQVEAQLRKANERFELATSAVPELIFDWDLEQNRVSRTEGLVRLLGFSPEEAEPTCDWWRDRIHPDDLPYLDDHNRILETRETGDRYRFEYRIRNREDQYIYVLDQGIIIRNELGNPIRIIGATIDITEQRQREAERELLLEREQAIRAAAEATNRVRDEFLLTLSHELRSPLNPILGWLSLLKTQTLSETATRNVLDVIERNALLQKQLVDDLLNVSMMLQGQLNLNFEIVDLVAVLNQAVESVRLAAQAKSLPIQIRIETARTLVLGDATRLQQVLWKLLSNAIKFTSVGQVTIQLRAVSTEIQIQVSDTGEGIDPQFIPYIFDPFRQFDSSTTRKFGGLGLGLAIARHLVELHGGRIEVESQGEAQGSTFTVYLPRLEANADYDR